MAWSVSFALVTFTLITFSMVGWVGRANLLAIGPLALLTLVIQLRPVSLWFGENAWQFTPNEVTLLLAVATLGPSRALLFWAVTATCGAIWRYRLQIDKLAFNISNEV